MKLSHIESPGDLSSLRGSSRLRIKRGFDCWKVQRFDFRDFSSISIFPWCFSAGNRKHVGSHDLQSTCNIRDFGWSHRKVGSRHRRSRPGLRGQVRIVPLRER